ncbi:MAG: methyltransferase domain-containing protein [Propionicimonas sp.]|uniref:class I SAM-dependent methyltransferase n=1 Tax=Propionicimonas sp. TaxID=1955623 RepID=UPI003D0D9324
MEVEGARTFTGGADAYDRFMGRYSRPLSVGFSDFAGVVAGQRVLDVGCGSGALTAELVRRLGSASVSACDPSPSFVAACRERFEDVDVLPGTAEQLPFGDAAFDVAISQLVLHFVSDPTAAGAEFARVLRPGGVAAACVWDAADGMELLRSFWDAASGVDPDAPDELQTLRFGRPGELSGWLAGAGFEDVTETTLSVRTTYEDFDELWSTLLDGVGPVGAYCATLPPQRLAVLRAALHDRLGAPSGGITLGAVARAARGVRPE